MADIRPFKLLIAVAPTQTGNHLAEHLWCKRTRRYRPRGSGRSAGRGNIAGWTGRCGNDGEALRLYQALLPITSECSAPITRIRSRPATTSSS